MNNSLEWLTWNRFAMEAQKDGTPIILLVEDNPSDIHLAKRAFRRSCILNELVAVEDGEEALDYLFGTGPFAGRPDGNLPILILLDLDLPKLSGLEVLRRIKGDARTCRTAVSILTATDDSPSVSDARDLGVTSFIRKPIDFKQLVEAVQQLGLYWIVLNKPPD